MANIRIKEKNRLFTVTVDEYPEIMFSEKTYEKARERAVTLVKEEILKDLPVIEEPEEETKKKVAMGFAA